MGIEIATELSRFTIETKYMDIPADVINFTKGLTLKIVAAMVAGSGMPQARRVSKIIKDRRLPEDVGVIGCNFKTSLWEGTFLNAYFAHNSELEDDRFGGGVSWDITVIPLLFPLAQDQRMSGKDLLEALAIGLEVHARSCINSASHLGVEVFPGAIGPAAAAARALGLSIEETTSAIGHALQGHSTTVQNFGTGAHFFESALQCLQGLMAAEMAQEGMDSNADLVTYLGNMLGKDNVAPDKILDGLGERWLLKDIWIKKYPCCLILHRYIDLIFEIMNLHKLSYEQIANIEAHTSPAEEICNRPEPKSIGDLQFSFQHILGSAILKHQVSLNQTSDYAVALDPQYIGARRKVKVIIHPELSNKFMGSPASITINTINGKSVSGNRNVVIGSPQEPLTMVQFKELYNSYTRGVLSQNQAEWVAETILNLEALNDVGELMDVLTFCNRSAESLR